MRIPRTVAVIVGTAVLAVTVASTALAAQPVAQASGHGTLDNTDGSKRQFSFHAMRYADGSVRGQATLVNPAFRVGNQPYRLKIDIQCMHVAGNIAVFGGMTESTNDPSLVDAVFFSVQDNGEPGRNNDRISRAFFWDDDPDTTGDPQACLLTGPNDFPLETISGGNIQVKQSAP